jgi:hypothetical protein
MHRTVGRTGETDGAHTHQTDKTLNGLPDDDKMERNSYEEEEEEICKGEDCDWSMEEASDSCIL